jgi:hypothetical protein
LAGWPRAAGLVGARLGEGWRGELVMAGLAIAAAAEGADDLLFGADGKLSTSRPRRAALVGTSVMSPWMTSESKMWTVRAVFESLVLNFETPPQWR